ncbi:MAG: Ig-like domain-containing protein [Planctomycetota bacterium]
MPATFSALIRVGLCLAVLTTTACMAAGITVHDRQIVVVTDAPGANGHEMQVRFTNDDGYYDNMGVEVVDPPSHGTVDVSAGWTKFTYTCTEPAGFTGTDSFDYRLVGDDGASNVATVHLLLRPVADPAGMRVILLVRERLLAHLGPELQRLCDDIDAAGYTADLRPTGHPGDYDGLRDKILEIYDEPQTFTAGVIMIGDFPVYKIGRDEFGDLNLWNITRTNDYHYDIWTSRMSYNKTSEWGDRLTLLQRHLDANHAYRTGAMRPPHRFTLFEGFEYMTYDPAHENLAVLWPDYNDGFDTTAEQTMRMGVAFHQNHGHGSGSSYEQGVGGDGMGRDKAFDIGNRCGIMLIGSCLSGKSNGVAAYQTATLDGFNVLTVGNTKEAHASLFIHESDEPHTEARTRIAAGDSWGNPLAEIKDSFAFKQFCFYGDLSLTINPAPHNEMPAITTLSADATTVSAGETVTFSVAATDADDGISHYHWWPVGFAYGLAPSHRSDDGSFTWTYDAPGTYTVRVRAFDHYRAHVDQEITITVTGSATNQPPLVRLMTPHRELAVPAGHDLPINAWARDLDGSVSSVRALVDDTQVGSDSSAPYRITWNAAGIGSHTVRVEAVDDDGAVTSSITRTVHVIDAAGLAPVVHLQVTETAGGHALSATAADPDGSISEVVFLADGVALGNDTTAPYTCSWTPTGGTTTLMAKAIDDEGDWSLSQPVVVTSAADSGRTIATTVVDPHGDPVPVSVRLMPGDIPMEDGGTMLEATGLDPQTDYRLLYTLIQAGG